MRIQSQKNYQRARSADVEPNIVSKAGSDLVNPPNKNKVAKVFPYLTLSESINNPKSFNEESTTKKKIEQEEDEGPMQAI